LSPSPFPQRREQGDFPGILKRKTASWSYLTAGRDREQIIDFEQYHANKKRVRELAAERERAFLRIPWEGDDLSLSGQDGWGNKIGPTWKTLGERTPASVTATDSETDKQKINGLFEGTRYKVIGRTAGHQKLTFRRAGSEQAPGNTENHSG
jgi:hypothetical protein